MSKYNTLVFCPDDYVEYNQYTQKDEPNMSAMYEDISSFLRTAMRHRYQVKVYNDSYCTIIEYDYAEPGMSDWNLTWEQISDLEEAVKDTDDLVIHVIDGDGITFHADTPFDLAKDAYNEGRTVTLVALNGIDLKPSRFEEEYIDFTGLAKVNNCYLVYTYHFTKDGITYDDSILSKIQIELENIGDNKYKSTTQNVAIAVQDAISHNAIVEIIADGQTYPYVNGNQQELNFGRIDPVFGTYVYFHSNKSDTFYRSDIPIPTGH